ncbi:hypothetical protein [Sediminibacterium soli]|uniref:hypothetical protein n=1 Tax=Sediminibacterium soli TaxID=2698829 RepID=UPI00137B1C41|nr:hypothetical protein [Sediminibacterium soli]NCI45295.1 hypothetical protein [Sediminibacterium soli]
MLRFLFVLLLPAFALPALSQHMHHTPAKPAATPKKDSVQHAPAKMPRHRTMDKPAAAPGKNAMQHEQHTQMQHRNMPMEGHRGMGMSHAFSRNLPMTRNGSGTSWLPDNSPVYAYMFHSGEWMYMLHGEAYLRYNKQDLFGKTSSRGGNQFDAPNMAMLMGQRNVGSRGLFHFSTMFSLDPLTVGASGYPLLFQTGETYRGQPLVDRQHPHDLFSELSVSYAYALSPRSDLFVYAGYPGEPAMGPSAYVHRPSGFFNPDAPLTHHWVDATHITFGVATLGFRYQNWKIEGSSFTGREPDEHRWGFDRPRLDSWSGRVSYNPNAKWALQVSHGFIRSPEALHPEEDINRTTASASFSAKGNRNSMTNITALWGMNKPVGHREENAILMEGTHTVDKTNLYARYEWVQKSTEELNLSPARFGENVLYPIHAVTAGAAYDIFQHGKTKFALGGQLSVYFPDNRLAPLYGSAPMAGQVYLRIYPAAMK